MSLFLGRLCLAIVNWFLLRPVYAQAEDADVLCLQETKLQDTHVEEAATNAAFEGWHVHWNCSGPPAKKGYSGVCIASR